MRRRARKLGPVVVLGMGDTGGEGASDTGREAEAVLDVASSRSVLGIGDTGGQSAGDTGEEAEAVLGVRSVCRNSGTAV